MTETFNGCTFSDVWASPSNWLTTTSLKGDWYAQCIFHDPAHEAKYPRGYQYRIRVNYIKVWDEKGSKKLGNYTKTLNKEKTIAKRRQALANYFDSIPEALIEQGYNPITGIFMIEQPIPEPDEESEELNPEMNIFKALRKAHALISGSEGHKYEVKAALNRTEEMAKKIHRHKIKSCDYKFAHLYELLEMLKLPDNYYNKFRTYFIGLFKILKKFGVVNQNLAQELDKKKVMTKPRAVLDLKDAQRILSYLEAETPEFHTYLQIFFYSGTRGTELLSIKAKDVRLKNQEYDVIIYKGQTPVWETKVILKNAISYWQDLLVGAKPEDFIFSKNLLPGPIHIDASQISRRWRRHVKLRLAFYNDELCTIESLKERGITKYRRITEDVYTFKHLFLDLLDEQQSNGMMVQDDILEMINGAVNDEEHRAKILAMLSEKFNFDVAQRMASHRSVNTTNRHYKTKQKTRENERLKNVVLKIDAPKSD